MSGRALELSVYDPGLPELSRALDVGRMGPILADAIGLERSRARDLTCSATILNHKPGRRCTVRYLLELGAIDSASPSSISLIGKLYRSSNRGERMYGRLRDLRGALPAVNGSLAVPATRAYLADLGMVVLEYAEGDCVGEMVTGARDEVPLALAAAWLASLHATSPLERLKVLTFERQLEKLDDWCACAAEFLEPALGERVSAARSALHAMGAVMTDYEAVMIHKDFYHAHVIWDGRRGAILDFDQLSVGDPAMDVGHFVGHLEAHPGRAPGTADSCEEIVNAFVAAYDRVSAFEVAARVPFYRAQTLLKLAATQAKRKRGNWVPRLRSIAEQACWVVEHAAGRGGSTIAVAPARFGAASAQPLDRLQVPRLELEAILPTGARIIEASTDDFGIGAALIAGGYTRYLGLTPGADTISLRRVRRAHPQLDGRLFALDDPGQLLRNNADVLVVSDPSIEIPKSIHKHRYARVLLWSPADVPGSSADTNAFIDEVERGRLQGKLKIVAVSEPTVAGSPRPVIVAEIQAKEKETARHYISPRMGVSEFFARLERDGVRSVVLRWHETLPDLPAGEDVDLLIADEDAERVEAILDDQPGLIPCDLYSVSGMPRSAYRKMAYYPPAVAEQILERRMNNERGFPVPSPADQLRSLAYHALYHKGEDSGLPTALPGVEPTASPEHDYARILGELAASLGVDVEVSMEGLDDYLAAEGWRPPMDTLGRLARKNRWIARRLNDLRGRGWEAYGGLGVFLIRRRAVELGCVDEIVERIARAGFHVVEQSTLSEERARVVARNARGGNWRTGPWPTSGGEPAVAVVVFDAHPIEPSEIESDKHPGLENARLLVKSEIRDTVNDKLPRDRRCNIIHSSDNTWGAWEYLQLAVPDRIAEVLATIDGLREAGADVSAMARAAGEGGE